MDVGCLARFVLALLLCSACGRIGFDAGATDARATDADVADGATDAPFGAFGPWSTPVEITQMNSANMEYGPTFSRDLLEVYVVTRRDGTGEIYRYTRTSISSPFDAGTPMTTINDPVEEDGEPSLSDDGSTLFFNRYAPETLYVSTRPTTTSTAWRTPVIASSLPEYANLAGYVDAEPVSPLRMLVALEPELQIFESTRSSPTAPWSVPVQIDLSIAGYVPCMRSDGLEILYEGRQTIDGTETAAIYRATRASVTEGFGPAEKVSFGDLDAAGVGDPELSPDGRTLIFSAQETLATFGYDIYIATREPL